MIFQNSASTTTTTTGKVTIITAVAKKKEDTSVQKGELMLNNVDLMEVYYSVQLSMIFSMKIELFTL